MGQAIINHDRHNAQVVRNALQKRNGCDTVGRLPVYCSDDATLIRALHRTPGVKFKSSPGRRALVVLEVQRGK